MTMGHSLFAWGDIYMDVKRVLSRGMSSSKNSKQWHFNDPRLINVHMSSVIKTVHYTWQCMSTTYCSSAQTKRTRQMFESIMEEQFEITKQLNSLNSRNCPTPFINHYEFAPRIATFVTPNFKSEFLQLRNRIFNRIISKE
jgi:hypothetical protein